MTRRPYKIVNECSPSDIPLGVFTGLGLDLAPFQEVSGAGVIHQIRAASAVVTCNGGALSERVKDSLFAAEVDAKHAMAKALGHLTTANRHAFINGTILDHPVVRSHARMRDPHEFLQRLHSVQLTLVRPVTPAEFALHEEGVRYAALPPLETVDPAIWAQHAVDCHVAVSLDSIPRAALPAAHFTRS